MATGVELGTAYLSLVASTSGLAPSVRKGMGSAEREADKSGKRAGKRFSGGIGAAVKGGARAIVAPIGAALATVGVAKFFKDSIDAASDLQEVGTKVNAIFGKSGASILQRYAETTATSIGQSKNAALDAASTFGVFGKSAGLSGRDLAKFSTDFVTLSSDMASFNNTTPEEAVEAIGAALRGESEPIRKYGVLLDDATLRNRALKLGLIETTKQALTPQQKVLAAQAEIYAQTKDAQGDFAKTSGGLANQQRILKAQFEDVKTQVGQFLLPVINNLAKTFTENVLPAVKNFIQGFKDGKGAGGQFRSALERVWEVLKSVGGFLVDHKGVVLALVGAWATWRVGLVAYSAAMRVVTVVTKAWAVATKVAAVAQRIFNAAMRANPIGLIITGITLLVGALVWFFTKTKVGKKIIQVVWKGIKAAIKGVADWWTKTAWPAIKKVLTAFGNGFKKAREIISNVWGKISNAIGTAWDWIKKNVFSKISLGLKILRAAFVFYRTKVQQIWNKFKEILKAGWDWVRKNVFDKIKGGLNAVRDRFASIRDRIKGIWTNLRDRLRDGWNWVRDNVFAKFKSGLGNLKDAFVNVKNGIRTAWNKLKEIAAKPVNFILGTVYNDGIRKWWNKISDAVGLSGLNLPRASTVKFASGGVLPGYTPGRDVHEFYSPTGGRLSLSGGEAIMRPEFTRAVGGPAGVAALNARARRGEAFADGGVWNWLGGVASGIGRGIKGFGNTLWNAGKMALEVIKDPIGAIKRAVSQIIGGAGTGGNRGDFFKIVGALPSKFAVGLADKVKSLFDSGKGKGASGIFGAGGGGVGGGGLRGNLSAMAAAARALDPSVRVTSGLRPGARTVTGYVSYHSRGRAIDMVSNNMGALWDKLYAAYGKSAPELFYSGRAFSRFGQKGAPRSDHWDHVHWAMANGGVLPKLFDQGGWLPTGTTLVQNNTGKPEPVFTSDQFERLASRGGDTYHIHGVDEASVISGIERVHRRAAVRNNMYGR